MTYLLNKKPILVGMIVLLFSVGTTQAQLPSDSSTIGGYLFAHMTRDDYGTLHYAVSEDGRHWRSLANGGRVMDAYRGHPDIITGRGGRHYLVGSPPEGKKIRIWESTDYIHWEPVADLAPDMSAVPEFNPVTYWHGAPKMYYDPRSDRYIITWHSATQDRDQVPPDDYWGSMRTLYITTSDFKTLSPPRRLLSYDLATIDVIIRRPDSLYYAIIKDERAPSADWPTGKSIRIATAPRLEGPYSRPGPPVSPNFREAPTLIPQRDGQGYYLYYEQYPGKQYEMSQAPSLDGPWYDTYTNDFSVPEEARHGCMVALEPTAYRRLLAAFGEQAGGQPDQWLYAGFKAPGDRGIWFSLSPDGLRWNKLRGGEPWLSTNPEVPKMRDPFLARDPRRGFHMVWTVGNRKIGYAHSPDLVHWSPPRIIPVWADNPDVVNVWAPEMFYHQKSKDWFIYWSSTVRGKFPEAAGQVKNDKNHRIYYMTTDDFRTFTEPDLFYDPGFPVIDATIFSERDRYYMIVKDERDTPLKKRLHITVADSILGPWEKLSEPLTESWTEGPSVIQQNSTYILYYDQYHEPKGMKARESNDRQHWRDISSEVSFPNGSKHGSFLRISAEEAHRLLRESQPLSDSPSQPMPD